MSKWLIHVGAALLGVLAAAAFTGAPYLIVVLGIGPALDKPDVGIEGLVLALLLLGCTAWFFAGVVAIGAALIALVGAILGKGDA